MSSVQIIHSLETERNWKTILIIDVQQIEILRIGVFFILEREIIFHLNGIKNSIYNPFL